MFVFCLIQQYGDSLSWTYLRLSSAECENEPTKDFRNTIREVLAIQIELLCNWQPPATSRVGYLFEMIPTLDKNLGFLELGLVLAFLSHFFSIILRI